ncbi:MAG: hypothetical protein ACFCUG_16395 [Thiotrichales bacterium]
MQGHSSRRSGPARPRLVTFTCLPAKAEATLRAQVESIVKNGWSRVTDFLMDDCWRGWKLRMFAEIDVERFPAQPEARHNIALNNPVRLNRQYNFIQSHGTSMVIFCGNTV